MQHVVAAGVGDDPPVPTGPQAHRVGVHLGAVRVLRRLVGRHIGQDPGAVVVRPVRHVAHLLELSERRECMRPDVDWQLEAPHLGSAVGR